MVRGRLYKGQCDPRTVTSVERKRFRLQINAPGSDSWRNEVLRRFRMPQGRLELVKRPIYFVGGDHERGTDTDGVVMRVLT